jgi:hypothetical protein
MKKHLYLALSLLAGQQLMAQLPDDALRMGWTVPSGTARSQAIGGAIGSLGGEITNTFVNPAGLGFFKVSEFVLSPGLSLAKSKSDYRGTNATSDGQTRFNISTSGFVSASSNPYKKWNSNAFSIAVNRAANFNNTIYYRGNNNYSSFSEAYSEEFSRSRISLDAVGSSNLSMGTKMAVYTYLIDTVSSPGRGTEIIGRPENLESVNQENLITTTGGITELALGYGANLQDKFYIGGAIGIPIVSYTRRMTFTESDPSGDRDNDFNFSRYEEKYTSKGAGFNAKLGIIVKPADQFRLGLAIHTPTLYSLRERVEAKMVTDVERYVARVYNKPNDPGIDSVTSDYYGEASDYKYQLNSPWRFLISGSLVLNEDADVSKQRGFITADAEYVTYGSSRFRSAEDNMDASFFDAVNADTKAYLKGAWNFRVGGELKFNTLMTRLGFAYYSSPYADKAFKAGRTNVSGGLGYRDRGIFIDLTYVHSMTKDVNFPYRLPQGEPNSKLNTYSDIKSNNGTVLLTFGVKI